MTFAGNENVFDPPVMGWSSWNTYRVNINEALIKKQADAMVQKGLKDAGYNYVNVDDGFFGWRDEHGTMQTHPERFPNGLKGVADLSLVGSEMCIRDRASGCRFILQ